MAVKNAINIYGTDYDLADGVNLVSSIETNENAIYNHPKGSYFLYNGLIYKAIDNIEVDDEIRPGNAGNCQRAYIGDTLFNIFGLKEKITLIEGNINENGSTEASPSNYYVRSENFINYSNPLTISINEGYQFRIVNYNNNHNIILEEEEWYTDSKILFSTEGYYFKIVCKSVIDEQAIDKDNIEIYIKPALSLMSGEYAANAKDLLDFTQKINNYINEFSKHFICTIPITFQSGQIDENTGKISRTITNQFAISDYILYTGETILKPNDDGIQYYIFTYNIADENINNFYDSNNKVGWLTDKEYKFNYIDNNTPQLGKYFRIMCRMGDGGVSFLPTSIENFTITNYFDQTLTQCAKPADAKAVGVALSNINEKIQNINFNYVTQAFLDGVINNNNLIERSNTDDLISSIKNIISISHEAINTAFSIGDYCINNNKLYRAKENISANQIWNTNKWEETQVTSELQKLDKKIISDKLLRVIKPSIEWETGGIDMNGDDDDINFTSSIRSNLIPITSDKLNIYFSLNNHQNELMLHSFLYNSNGVYDTALEDINSGDTTFTDLTPGYKIRFQIRPVDADDIVSPTEGNILLQINNDNPTSTNQIVIGNSNTTNIVFFGNKKLIFNQDGTVTWEALT